MEKIKGQEIELRHILSEEAQTAAREKIRLEIKLSLRKLLLLKLPEQNQTKKETRANGSLINPKTQDTRFELTKWIQVYTSFKLERRCHFSTDIRYG
jgi:peptidyl-prolyl cis-trans isomerase SurA